MANKAEKTTTTAADIEKEAEETGLNFITTDGKDKKQGQKVVKKVFGLVIETNY